jgi:hypothetical protein
MAVAREDRRWRNKLATTGASYRIKPRRGAKSAPWKDALQLSPQDNKGAAPYRLFAFAQAEPTRKKEILDGNIFFP